MKENLRVSLGAVILALATLAAVIFAWLNFVQRSQYDLVDDGVSWSDSAHGIEAWKVAPDSPAYAAGIHAGDLLEAINDAPVPSAAHVARRLYRAGLWTQLRYKLSRNGEEFETRLITTPAHKPVTVENYLRLVGLLYLFIGLFIFIRRWNAPRAIHFYVFCLVSFVLYSFQYSGKLDAFDLEVYWASVVARLFAPALLLHFAFVFPERSEAPRKSLLKLAAVYVPLGTLLLIHILAAVNALGFVPTTRSRVTLDQLELAFLGLYFLVAGAVFYLSFRRAHSGVLRQQLKWLMGGTLAGSLPFTLLYIIPYLFNAATESWMQFSALSLVLIPLCFGYAIIRYRLMDVDIIFKRGLAYTAATAAVAAVYFALVALIAEIFHAQASGPVAGMIAIVVAAFLFQPFREGIQSRLDRFFYRDRLDYRRTLIEFGRTLTNEVRLEPMLGSVMDRVSQTLLVDRLAIFVEDPVRPGEMRLARSMGVRLTEPLDFSFISCSRPEFARGPLFFEAPRSAREVTDSIRRTLEQLDLNYYIPCRIREHTVAVLGLGKTVDGDFLSSDDVELVQTIAGYVAIALDNSQLYSSLEQKAFEVARLKDFSENIVESLNVGVLAVDLDGTVEAWNSRMEQVFGVSRADAVGQPLSSLLPPGLVEEIAARDNDQEQITGIYKHRFERQGRSLVLNVSITPLVGKSSERIGRLLLFEDVTQRERVEEQMTQTEKLTSLGLLAAGVAHEVNTPLAVISNYIQMLAKQMPDGDPRHSIIDKIVKQTFRASEIVNNLLNFSRTGPGELADIDVNRVVEETLSLVAHPLKTSQIRVVKQLSGELPRIRGSANKLQQVFLNLFLNARDAMPTGGMLEVRTAAHNGSVEIEIADTGNGIAREHIHRIFDPFFTTKPGGRGTGLGLSVSYGIIKEHAGKIDVRSTPGRGTSFHVEFPAVRKAVHV
jgi:two-component system, NtrC family, sensor kinase